jgi:hypothetical protein
MQELGLFDYLSRRLAICGNPQDCLAQALPPSAAVRKLMLTVSLASDPSAPSNCSASTCFRSCKNPEELSVPDIDIGGATLHYARRARASRSC